MSSPDENKVTKERLRHLALIAGLSLTEERLEELAPQVEKYFSLISRLDRLTLGDIGPATTFALRED